MNVYLYLIPKKIISWNFCRQNEYFNISNHDPLEQEPLQEQGLIVILCEYFYAGEGCWV